MLLKTIKGWYSLCQIVHHEKLGPLIWRQEIKEI